MSITSDIHVMFNGNVVMLHVTVHGVVIVLGIVNLEINDLGVM